MGYILGIDQGSSKTQVIIGDKYGTILGTGRSYGACHSNSGLDYAMEAIKQASYQAMEKSNLAWNAIDVIAAGLTGIDWDYEADLLKNKLSEISKVKKVIVKNDCIIAMRAGTTNTYRSVICAGSGLNCAVHKSDEDELVFGFFIEEEFQGGKALGKACLKAVIASDIGMEKPTLLTEMLLDYFQVNSVTQLLYLRTTDKITHDQYLHLPMILEKAAILEDPVALSIWINFGKQFARYIVCGLRKFDLLDKKVDIVISGSIFKCKCQVLKQSVLLEIEQYAPKAIIVDAEYEPVVGAYLMGLDFVHGSEFTDEEQYLVKSVELYGLKR